MIAEPFAVGIRIVDERPLEDRRDDVAQSVMHNPVAVGRGGNHSLLRFDYLEGSVFSWMVGFSFKLHLQLRQFFAQPVVEAQNIFLIPFAALGFFGCRQQIAGINYLWPQIAVTFHFVSVG